jgi:hypothetical protein
MIWYIIGGAAVFVLGSIVFLVVAIKSAPVMDTVETDGDIWVQVVKTRTVTERISRPRSIDEYISRLNLLDAKIARDELIRKIEKGEIK